MYPDHTCLETLFGSNHIQNSFNSLGRFAMTEMNTTMESL